MYSEDETLNAHLSSLYKTKHPSNIPQIPGLLFPALSSSKMWQLVSKDILTPFAPSFKFYDYEKYLPKRRNAKKYDSKICSRDNFESYFTGESFQDSMTSLLNSPKNFETGSLTERKSINKKSKEYYYSGQKIIKDVKFNEKNEFRKKSYSFTSQKKVVFYYNEESKKSPSSSKFDKLRKFALNNSQKSLQSIDTRFSLENIPSLNMNSENKNRKEKFRRKSCTCSKCGKNGKLDKILTDFGKENLKKTEKIEKETPKNSPIEKLKNSFNKKGSFFLPNRQNILKEVVSRKSYKEFFFGNAENAIKKNSIALKKDSIEEEMNSAEIPERNKFFSANLPTKTNSKFKITTSSKRNSKEGSATKPQNRSNFFILNSYGYKNDEKNTFNRKTKCWSNLQKKSSYSSLHHESLKKVIGNNQNVSEIVYLNGSFRTKNILGESKKKLLKTEEASPYFNVKNLEKYVIKLKELKKSSLHSTKFSK